MRRRHGWPTDPARVRILSVDDDPDIQLLLRSVLVHFEHDNIEIAKTPAQALDALRERPPTLMFLDIHLAGGASGFSVLQALAEHAERPFVTMLSSASTPDNLRRALAAGADHFIVKPFTSSKVQSLLQQVHARLAGLRAAPAPARAAVSADT